ncbi:Hypothetical protein, putative [Bodo saltans]|uniref:Uncharacterized protein n=1 Tax=Bodo saltans TaxID=75058 RepID=A0A0S4JGW2_BODSA|nr:Hypothetical protein, putative [Bodo saltans]|eukprot:CUG89177.1 Hypothetical protein, putative [Bodo saltans]
MAKTRSFFPPSFVDSLFFPSLVRKPMLRLRLRLKAWVLHAPPVWPQRGERSTKCLTTPLSMGMISRSRCLLSVSGLARESDCLFASLENSPTLMAASRAAGQRFADHQEKSSVLDLIEFVVSSNVACSSCVAPTW